jgi:hypothetical protein
MSAVCFYSGINVTLVVCFVDSLFSIFEPLRLVSLKIQVCWDVTCVFTCRSDVSEYRSAFSRVGPDVSEYRSVFSRVVPDVSEYRSAFTLDAS